MPTAEFHASQHNINSTVLGNLELGTLHSNQHFSPVPGQSLDFCSSGTRRFLAGFDYLHEQVAYCQLAQSQSLCFIHFNSSTRMCLAPTFGLSLGWATLGLNLSQQQSKYIVSFCQLCSTKTQTLPDGTYHRHFNTTETYGHLQNLLVSIRLGVQTTSSITTSY